MPVGESRWRRVNELFHAALVCTPDDRDAFLARECGADSQLRLEVQSLLRAHDAAGSVASVSVSAGTRLGDYEVTSFIAAGAMGQVYCARDTKLGRDVALKILPPAFVGDPDRRARFAREARLLASLNHPHIATIYGFVESDGVSALALELVDGETLAERIARGKLPVEEALRIARQIAEALEAAHEQGIIHRDLKPANIKLTRDGTVKVLDFGLAKLAEAGQLAAGSMFVPTLTTAGAPTGIGVLIGTPAYMSPEQARGEAVDKRTDLWALGCVLFEMLTGKPAFDGSTITDVLARVLEREPDLGAVPASLPSSIQTLLRRCFEKDVRRRIDSAAVARLDIDDAMTAATRQRISPRRGSAAHRRFAITLGAVLVAATALVATWLASRAPSGPELPLARFEIVLPLERSIWPSGDGLNVAISPDGTRVAYAASGSPTGESELVIRRLDQLEGMPVPDTAGARSPFFSPDGRWVAFFAGNEIKKVVVTGGAPMTICRIVPLDENRDASGAWGPNDIIYFSRDRDDGNGLRAVEQVNSRCTVQVALEEAAHGLGDTLVHVQDYKQEAASIFEDTLQWQLEWPQQRRREYVVRFA
jgi:eukaryotic-like serine/threonine-protein kinase